MIFLLVSTFPTQSLSTYFLHNSSEWSVSYNYSFILWAYVDIGWNRVTLLRHIAIAGATLACGTGACALVVAAVLEGRIERVSRWQMFLFIFFLFNLCRSTFLSRCLITIPHNLVTSVMHCWFARGSIRNRMERRWQSCLHDRSSWGSVLWIHPYLVPRLEFAILLFNLVPVGLEFSEVSACCTLVLVSYWSYLLGNFMHDLSFKF